MNDPSKQNIGWGKVLRINAQFAFGALILFYGWLCWQGVSLKWWGLWPLAVMCFIGGAIQIIQATVEAISLILRLRRWGIYRDQGVSPRADHMAQDSDFEGPDFKNGGPTS